jgi:hypothetical protein
MLRRSITNVTPELSTQIHMNNGAQCSDQMTDRILLTHNANVVPTCRVSGISLGFTTSWWNVERFTRDPPWKLEGFLSTGFKIDRFAISNEDQKTKFHAALRIAFEVTNHGQASCSHEVN